MIKNILRVKTTTSLCLSIAMGRTGSALMTSEINVSKINTPNLIGPPSTKALVGQIRENLMYFNFKIVRFLSSKH